MKIKCPACSKVLSIPESAAGKVVKCPCGKQLRAPAGAGTPGAASQPPQKKPAQPKRPTPARPAAKRPTPQRPTPARPSAQRAPAPAPAPDSLFDDLTDQDLQPVKPVSTPGKAISTKSNPSKVLEKYASEDDKRGTVLLGPRADFEVASPGSRILAVLIDGIFIGAFVGIALGIGIAVAAGGLDAGEEFGAIHFIILGGIAVPQIINAILISMSGQTIGKKVLGIQIVSDATGAPAGFTNGYLIRTIGFNFLTNIPLIGFCIAIADVVYLFTDGHRTLHDQWAGTSVAKLRRK